MATEVPAWWTVAMHWGYYVGLASVLGGSLAYLIALRPGLRPETSELSADQCATLHRRSVRFLRRAGVVFMITAYGLFATKLTPTGDGVSLGAVLGAAVSPTAIGQFVSTPVGADEWASYEDLVVAQNVLYALVVLALLALVREPVRRHLTMVARAAVVLTVAGCTVTSLPTSLTGPTLDDLQTAAFDLLHIVAGATWVGGLLYLALMTRRHVLGGPAGQFWAGVWQRFSVLALTAVGAVVTSGVWLAWKDVGSVSELWTTTFGRFLTAKLLLVGLLVCAGAYNQLILTPRIVRDVRISRATEPPAQGRGRVPGFPTVVIVETLLACGVLLIVPFLTAGSARAQAGSPPAATLNAGLLALSVTLVVALGVSLYATHRLSSHLTRREEGVPA
ncbi:MAG TPA: CopD family protein [Pseudonocardia sp.]|jgi:putative copper export protein